MTSVHPAPITWHVRSSNNKHPFKYQVFLFGCNFQILYSNDIGTWYYQVFPNWTCNHFLIWCKKWCKVFVLYVSMWITLDQRPKPSLCVCLLLCSLRRILKCFVFCTRVDSVLSLLLVCSLFFLSGSLCVSGAGWSVGPVWNGRELWTR